jgi:hypothetical protein
MTTTQQQQAAIVRNEARIIDLLHWTLAKYYAYMYDTGISFLENYTGNDESIISKLTPQETFWNWWKNLFNARNEAFIHEWDGLEDTIPVGDLVKLYGAIHSPAMLASEIHPPKVVYGEKFTSIQMA